MVFFMPMAIGNRVLQFLLLNLFWLFLNSNTCFSDESDIQCLKTLKTQLKDPSNSLSSWTFTNLTEGFICKFDGIECWKPDESRVLNIRLSNMGLQGQFPIGLKNCKSITGLDLSSNQLSGSLPGNIAEIIPYIVTLDLSSNDFSGELPPKLGNLTYVNVLNLQHNQFTGQIPWQLTQLTRLTTFNVAYNSLSGQIPAFTTKSFPASNFATNSGLCGTPLEACHRNSKVNLMVIILLAVGGAGVGFFLAFVGLFCCYKWPKNKDEVSVMKEEDIQENNWVMNIKETDGIKVSMYKNSVAKMRLHDLMKATNNFSNENIMNSGRRGNMFKATLSNGSLVAVKRLRNTQPSKAEFISEMTTLGKLKHRNLISLLGFCIARKERLLVYEYMPKRTLYQQLHRIEDGGKFMEWPLRLKIALGVARGLAWLHHNCNPCVIHRNISSKCILLDEDNEPKISDFGFAQVMNPLDTHLTTFVNGQFGNLGYVAPEYTRVLVAISKGDVYSFGILLLELISGKVPTQEANPPHNFKQNLVEWIVYLSVNSLLLNAADKSLIGGSYDSEILECLKLAYSCVASLPEERPTMLQIYQLIRVIGNRYGFSADDEIPMQPNNINDHADNSNEEISEIHEMYE